MHIVKGKKTNALILLALDPIPIHRPASENAQNDKSAEYKQDSVNAEKDETAKTWILAVEGE